MPIYEYRCENGHLFDALQSMSDDPLTKCEECGAPVERVMHAPAIHYKGSGFYSTDYGSKKKNAQDSKKASDSSSSGSGSSDSGSSGSSSDSGSSGSGSSGSSGSGSSDSGSSGKAKAASKSD